MAPVRTLAQIYRPYDAAAGGVPVGPPTVYERPGGAAPERRPFDRAHVDFDDDDVPGDFAGGYGFAQARDTRAALARVSEPYYGGADAPFDERPAGVSAASAAAAGGGGVVVEPRPAAFPDAHGGGMDAAREGYLRPAPAGDEARYVLPAAAAASAPHPVACEPAYSFATGVATPRCARARARPNMPSFGTLAQCEEECAAEEFPRAGELLTSHTPVKLQRDGLARWIADDLSIACAPSFAAPLIVRLVPARSAKENAFVNPPPEPLPVRYGDTVQLASLFRGLLAVPAGVPTLIEAGAPGEAALFVVRSSSLNARRADGDAVHVGDAVRLELVARPGRFLCAQPGPAPAAELPRGAPCGLLGVCAASRSATWRLRPPAARIEGAGAEAPVAPHVAAARIAHDSDSEDDDRRGHVDDSRPAWMPFAGAALGVLMIGAAVWVTLRLMRGSRSDAHTATQLVAQLPAPSQEESSASMMPAPHM